MTCLLLHAALKLSRGSGAPKAPDLQRCIFVPRYFVHISNDEMLIVKET